MRREGVQQQQSQQRQQRQQHARRAPLPAGAIHRPGREGPCRPRVPAEDAQVIGGIQARGVEPAPEIERGRQRYPLCPQKSQPRGAERQRAAYPPNQPAPRSRAAVFVQQQGQQRRQPQEKRRFRRATREQHQDRAAPQHPAVAPALRQAGDPRQHHRSGSKLGGVGIQLVAAYQQAHAAQQGEHRRPAGFRAIQCMRRARREQQRQRDEQARRQTRAVGQREYGGGQPGRGARHPVVQRWRRRLQRHAALLPQPQRDEMLAVAPLPRCMAHQSGQQPDRAKQQQAQLREGRRVLTEQF